VKRFAVFRTVEPLNYLNVGLELACLLWLSVVREGLGKMQTARKLGLIAFLEEA